MNAAAKLNALIDTWTHGARGIGVLYILIAAFSLAGLIRGRAAAGAYLLWPVTTVVTLLVVALLMQAILWALGTLAGQPIDGKFLVMQIVFYMAGGFLGGLYWARQRRPLAAVERRGAKVFDGHEVERATRKLQCLPRRAVPVTDHSG